MYDQGTRRRIIRIRQLAEDIVSAEQRADDARTVEAGAAADKLVETLSHHVRSISLKLSTTPLVEVRDEVAGHGYDTATDILSEELAIRDAYLDLYPQEVGR